MTMSYRLMTPVQLQLTALRAARMILQGGDGGWLPGWVVLDLGCSTILLGGTPQIKVNPTQ